MSKKAKEWAAEFETAPDVAAALKSFISEIGDVAKSRCDKMTANAVEGAVREQRMKFEAVLRLCPKLAGQKFDQLLAEYGKDYQKVEDRYRHGLERAKNPAKPEESKQEKGKFGKPKDRLRHRRPDGAPAKHPSKVA